MSDALLLRQVRWYAVKRTSGPPKRDVYDIIANTSITGDVIARDVRTVALARRIARLHNRDLGAV